MFKLIVVYPLFLRITNKKWSLSRHLGAEASSADGRRAEWPSLMLEHDEHYRHSTIRGYWSFQEMKFHLETLSIRTAQFISKILLKGHIMTSLSIVTTLIMIICYKRLSLILF